MRPGYLYKVQENLILERNKNNKQDISRTSSFLFLNCLIRGDNDEAVFGLEALQPVLQADLPAVVVDLEEEGVRFKVVGHLPVGVGVPVRRAHRHNLPGVDIYQ